MADDRDGALGAVQRIADAAADAGDVARGLHVGGRLTGVEIAQPALELFARFLAGFGGDRRLDARDFLAEQAEAARGDEIPPDRDRQLLLGLFIFVFALRSEERRVGKEWGRVDLGGRSIIKKKK